MSHPPLVSFPGEHRRSVSKNNPIITQEALRHIPSQTLETQGVLLYQGPEIYCFNLKLCVQAGHCPLYGGQ